MGQLFVGLLTEGSTDERFLAPIVERTLNDIVFAEVPGEHDVNVILVDPGKGLDFVETVLAGAEQGLVNFGIRLLCVHTDADNTTANDVYRNKINPAKDSLAKKDEANFCKIIAALVPVQEMEAWMLADKDLLKKEIGTDKTEAELGIARAPEAIARPKEVIEEAIRLARADLAKRRRGNLQIGDLYASMAQKIAIERLNHLPSYQDFKENIRAAFIELNLLHH
jgi:Domain of unknown function (DUF4276)